jgi:hypothetical protein
MRACRLAPASFLAVLLCLRPGTSGAEAPAISVEDARELLFDALPEPEAVTRCLEEGAVRAPTEETRVRVRCLLQARYRKDPRAARLALELHERTGCVAGLLAAQDFDGGYRGQLRLVPHLPVGPEVRHLEFVTGALLELDDFFARLTRTAGQPPRYRWRALSFRFFRSVKRRTPAAFAHGWTVGYNVSGTLNHSTRAVRDLLFHEIFHLNDQAQGDWSARALGDIHRVIVKRCGRRAACLEPYARGWLKVRGGTYYAFMPGHGPEEYAAELALNYLREQLAASRGERVGRPFKCGPELNARAWRLIVDEFFAGVDLVPACPPPR